MNASASRRAGKAGRHRGASKTLRPGWLVVDGYPVYHRECRTAGPDAPAIVHVHGFGISGTYLEPTAERLTGRFRTFVPDLPGMGRSMRHHPPLDIPGLAHALMSYCDQVGVERATFVGNSLGCPIICEVAGTYPDRIERAVLVSPAGGPTNQPLRRAIGQMALDGPREPLGMVPIAVRDYLRFGVLEGLRLFKSMTEYPTLERVRHLTMPTLLVAGARDPLVRVERVTVFSGLPHVAAVKVPGAHALNFSDPELIAALIEAHVDGTPLHIAKGPLSVVEVLDIPA
jgi:pimeloyl-ACP methyl ester carboxylesterase